MKNTQRLAHWPAGFFAAALALFLFTGCKSTPSSSSASTAQPTPAPAPVATPAAPVAPPVAATPAVPPAPVAVAAPATGTAPPPPVRIKAGPGDSFKDADGNTWIAEQGFADGDTVERPDAQIAGTKTPAIYRSERYSMTSFSYPVPNGKYTVKLHFCETYEGITDKGQRVFSFNVEGQDFKGFDVFAKSGGALHAYIETVNVTVTDGKLDVKFTPEVENPQINGIEILPNP